MFKFPPKYILMLCLALLVILFNGRYSSAQRKPLYEKDSLYYHIIVLEDSRCRYLKFDFNMGHFQCGIYLDNPDKSCLGYIDGLTLGFAFNPSANDILHIGLGGGSLPKLLYKINPDLNMDAVELDVEVLKVAERFFYFKNGVHANVFINDARIYVKRTKKKYDIIILDAYKSEFIPYHLLTKEYFAELSSILKAGGLLVFNIYDPHNQQLYKPVTKTLQTIFNDVSIFDIFGIDDPSKFIVARNSKHKTTLESLKSGARIFKNKYGFDLEQKIETFKKEIHIDKNIPLFTDDYSPGSLYRFAN